VAGFTTRNRSAGHPSRSTKTRHALKLKPDHPIGAVHDPDRCFDLVGAALNRAWRMLIPFTMTRPSCLGSRSGETPRDNAYGAERAIDGFGRGILGESRRPP
jgi:hypothetical protein